MKQIPSNVKEFIIRHYGVVLLLGSIVTLGLTIPTIHVLFPWQQSQDIADSPYLRIDPEKIVLSDRDDRVPCGECHAKEYDEWKASPHSTGFDEMHRSAQAQSILEKMDFRLSKRESLCLRCHYTAQIVREEARAIAGVSCESCHGAARDWLEVHNNYDGATHETESAEHAAQRAQQSAANGMLRPSDNLYGVAANCFECHTVPSEELINQGRHPSGSKFELVEWSGKIQHNYLQAQWSNDETNRERTPERKRMLYTVGRILDYEYSMRAVAEATQAGSYAKAMERRVASAVRELEQIVAAQAIDEVVQVLRLHKDARIGPGNKSSLLGIADQVRALGQQFTKGHDGSALGAIDQLVRGERIAVPEPVAATAPTEAAAPATTTPATSAAPQTAPSAAAEVTVQISGERRTRPAWFETANFETTLPGCNCHSNAEDWLFDDPHSGTANILLDNTPRATEIARLYGLSATQIKQGNQICMQCHGTIETGAEASQVFEGVTCESCHGPSSGYLRPHKNGNGFENGLVQLKQASVRAANCARCHHITDERLLSAGHSTGEGYNIASGNNAIKHWPDPDLERSGTYPEVSGDALRSAFASIVQQRPVPQVQVAKLSAPPAAPAVARSATPRRSSPAASTRSAPPAPPRARPVARIPQRATLDLSLPPLPSVTDSTSTEDILLIVKQRLELLYKNLGRDE